MSDTKVLDPSGANETINSWYQTHRHKRAHISTPMSSMGNFLPMSTGVMDNGMMGDPDEASEKPGDPEDEVDG